ncbi:hypothetical protein CYY_009546 [Polysphondylium violaceum]|uniref:COMM domain-containing protein n=1 Tax=Polysphondylium violaceum TaxID=133409 RepID=A0A8J4PJX5_9MYCE|nr:hypothetical protein CYY_009546 [Polysphondylium violaceum]
MEKQTKYYSLQISHQEKLFDFLSKITLALDVKQTSHFIHTIIDQICGRLASFDSFVDESKQNHERLIRQLVYVYTIFINKVVGRDLKKEYIIEDLNTAKVPEDYTNTISDCILSRFQDIKRELTEKLSSISSSSLTDFDWKMNAILSSDRINVVSENVLLLNLTIDTHNENEKKKQVLVEMTKKEMDHLLEIFDQINDAIQAIKV